MKKIFKRLLCASVCFVTLQLSGYVSSLNDPGQPVSKQSLHSIAVFNKVYGYVRHFSPSLAVDTFYGWEDLLLKYLPRVESESWDVELCDIIMECFYPLDTNIMIESYDKRNQLGKTETKPCAGFYVYRNSHGWGNRGENAVKMVFPMYISSVQKTDKFIDFKTVYQNISFSMPLVACVNDSIFNCYNQNRAFDPNSRKGKYNVSNKYVRMGIIMEAWNAIEYYYPYLQELKIDNEAIFEKYIRLVSADMNESQFFEILEKFGAEYKDGHAGFMPFTQSLAWPDYVPPLKLQMIENKLILTYVADTMKHLINVGDRVLKIDNIPAERYFKNKQLRVSSATPTWNKYASEKELLCGYENTAVKLELLKNNKKEIIELRRSIKARANESNANSRPNYYEIKKGYYYVNLFNLNDSLLDYAMKNILPQTQGIVFDVRGYPKTSRIKELFGHLTNDTIYSSNWSIPIQTYPGQKEPVSYIDPIWRWVLPPLLPRFTDNVVFITDGRIISAGEGFMSIAENYKLGKIVGEQTAGTNGNINTFQMFGLYQFWHTQMYTPRYDGSPFHGRGIIPEVKLKPRSIQDVIDGRDVFLIEAIKMLR